MDSRNPDLSLGTEDSYGLDSASGSSARTAYGFGDAYDILRRGWRFPFYCCAISLAAALIYVLATSAPYKSSARILIDRSVNRYLQTNRIVDQPTFDEGEVASQVFVLSSDSVVVPVVRSMQLTQDSEFSGTGSASSIGYSLSRLGDFFRQFLNPQPVSAPEREAALERNAVEGVVKRLSVNREDVANVINISFESQDAAKAARIANALADTYVSGVLEAKLESTKVVGQWLQDRLTELKNQSTDADRALQDFKVAHNLTTEGGNTQNSELFANLRTQLANARIAAAEAKQRLDLIRRSNGDGILTTVNVDALLHGSRSGAINFALNNTDLVRLRTQYRELKARETDLEPRIGRKHAVMIKLRQQIDGVDSAIENEEKRIADVYTSEYQVAKARETELAASVEKLAGRIGGGSPEQTKLRELENSAETLRGLYNTFLQKFKEIHTAQSEALPIQNARIITRAVPAQSKSPKKAIVILGGGTMLGLLLGFGFIIGREWAADVFRSSKAVERVADRKCIILPKVDPKSSPIEEYVLDAPYSRFTEGLRNVKATIDSALVGHGGKVIGIVSSVTDEGKTMVATNLASLIASSSGARALVIDSDLHFRKLSTTLATEANVGFLEALKHPDRLNELVVRRERSGLDILPCESPVRIPNAAELLGSLQTEQLLTIARKSYDYIVVEIAPVMSVVDLKKIERFIDAFVFVVEWGQTKQSLVIDALSEAHMIRDRLVGLVLNKADPDALLHVESFNGSKLTHYYQD